MFDILSQMLSYGFIVRAILVGTSVALCSSLLGINLVLKRYSMIGDALSRVGFGSLALAAVLGLAPLVVSVPMVVLAAFLLLMNNENSKIKGDAVTALVSTGFLATGVIFVSISTGMNTDVCGYMFGSILAVGKHDLLSSLILSGVVIALYSIFYNKIFAVTFDENFARATGINITCYKLIIAFLTAITMVLGMKLMGALLISALVIFPPITSMRVCKTFKSVAICSPIVSICCFFAGVIFSYLYQTPTGASVVVVNIIVFLAFWLISTINRSTIRH